MWPSVCGSLRLRETLRLNASDRPTFFFFLDWPRSLRRRREREMVVRVCCKAGRVPQHVLSQAGPRSGGAVLRRDRRAAWGPLASLPGGGRAESEGGGERELDLEDILKRGKEESASFVFSFDEDEDDAVDWMDAHFEG